MRIAVYYSFTPWTDVRHLCGWRVQAHIDGRRGRLVTPRRRIAHRGDVDACQQRLDEIARREGLRPSAERYVLTLHGLARSAASMRDLSTRLSAVRDAEPVNFHYAATRQPVEAHARALDGVLSGLAAGARLDIVAHSLGNIVVRRWFKMLADGQSRCPRGRFVLGRMVMLGPPNQGSRVAYRLRNWPLFRRLLGETGQELGAGWDALQPRLAVPPLPFGIITGHVGGRLLVNPFLAGPSDLIVSEEETRLDGAADYLELPTFHARLTNVGAAIDASERFLLHGRF